MNVQKGVFDAGRLVVVVGFTFGAMLFLGGGGFELGYNFGPNAAISGMLVGLFLGLVLGWNVRNWMMNLELPAPKDTTLDE